MGSDTRVPTPPAGLPRFVAAVPSSGGGWRAVAESTAREPIDLAVAGMVQTVQARGEAPVFEVWGPTADGQQWQHFETVAPGPGKTRTHVAPSDEPARSAREERLLDRRYQVLTSALASAGVPLGDPEDDAALSLLIALAEEGTIRRLAHWLAQART
ncbi:hypothetical protein QFZ68_003300 [Streptomyces sp. V1I6]|nr:hypothetical protein [Streptomyces sp. V1I6]